MSEGKGIKVWRIDLSSYPVKTPDGKEDMFDVRASVAAVLFHPDAKLAPEEMFKAKDVADRVREAEGDTVLLDNEQMAQVRKGYNCMRGGPETQVEFLRRIKDAEQVELDQI